MKTLQFEYYNLQKVLAIFPQMAIADSCLLEHTLLQNHSDNITVS